jgi:hypothetical protein
MPHRCDDLARHTSQSAARTGWRGRSALIALLLLSWSGLQSPSASQSGSEWPIVELRQYTLKPGGRDVLIPLFESEFVESQEAVGMRIVGTFRDLDRPDRFVWLRAFRDMASRATALTSFYSGPIWKAHGKAAATTMIDSSNVLLLREARPRSGFAVPGTRPPKGATAEPHALIVANICSFKSQVDSAFVEFFDATAVTELKAAGIPVLATYVTESAPNDYPALPVRADHVLVWFTQFADRVDYERRIGVLRSSARWTSVEDALRRACTSAPEALRLQPTPRSLLGG